jgi:hypothetical protein
MKKILLNESERKAAILDREKAIVENFAKTFNKIKRLDENEVAGMETKELEKKAFDFANSPEMGQLVDKILAKSKPEDLQKIKTALGSVSESMMYESDFSSFLNIAHKAQSTLSEDNSAGNLQNSVGKALQNFGVANIMSMGMLPAVVSIAVDYLGGPNLLQAVGNAVGTGGGGTAALSVVASLIGGALLWRLGKAVSGEKVTGDTPLFEIDENEVNSNNASPEALVDKAVDKMEHDSSIPKVAQQIANDPKAMAELQKVLSNLGINVNEGVGINPEQIALAFVKKSGINEDAGAGFWAGLLGGGALAHYIYSVPAVGSVIAGASTSPMTETMIGSIIGATLGVLAAYIYQKRKANNSNQA